MYGGIDQLVNTYKGNPQPLQAKVQQAQGQMQNQMKQQAQQGQPPGAIPPDLEEALALQKITELRQGAQNQQAMQAGGAQPTVVQKLQQMLGGMQQQAQMQGQPVMAARGGSIAHLVSNLGQNYAGGGIVAFNGKDQSKVPSEEELEAQRKADRAKIDALTRTLGETGGEYAGKSMAALADIAALVPRGLAGAVDTAMIRPARALGANVDYLSPALTPGNQSSDTMTPFYDRYIRAKEGAGEKQTVAPTEAKGSATAAPSLSDIRGQLNAADAARFAEKPAPKPPVANAPAAPRPPAANAGIGGGPAAPAKPAIDPNSLRALSEKYIRDEMGLNPESESDKAVARARKLMGLDELLKEKEGRASAKEKYIEEMKAKRAPLWIDALMSAGKPTRGGIAGVLGNMAVGASAAKQNYEAEDLKYIDELNRLRDVITDAKITGNKELAKEALAAFKETDARRKAALTSATSLLNVDQQTEASNARAKEALAARAQATAMQLEAKKSERQQRQQNFLAQEERKWQDTLNKNPDYKKLVDQRSMQERLLYMSTDPATQEKAQAAVDMLNERISKMLPTAGGGTVNIPPPPKGAVTRVG